ncbi:MAG: hypothetical protein VW257_10395, partial [Quisquiliibacterium sp.]
MSPKAGQAAAGTLRLGFGLSFEDLYRRDGLVKLDASWLDWLARRDAPLADRLVRARLETPSLAKDEASLLVDLSPALDGFIGELFGIDEELDRLRHAHDELAPLIKVKWKFVKRQALLKVSLEQLQDFDADQARAELEKAIGEPFEELSFSRAIIDWQDQAAGESSQVELARQRLDLAMHYCAWATITQAGQAAHPQSILFRQPGKVDPLNLLQHAHSQRAQDVTIHVIDPAHIRRREGFALTDQGVDLRGALDQANYCIWCHKQGKDSCSKGLREKPDAQGKAAFKKTLFGVKLAGCP